MSILVTGAAGFIGTHLVRGLLEVGLTVIGVDTLSTAKDGNLKLRNLNSNKHKNFYFLDHDLTEKKFPVLKLTPTVVVHLAAKTGVRDSGEKPDAYLSNIISTNNLIQWMISTEVKNICFASSSSVYGKTNSYPARENDPLKNQKSFYAWTKASCETLIQHLSERHGLSYLNLRLFNVYGPRMRDDLLIHRLLSDLQSSRATSIFGDGEQRRDFTYVDDVVDAFKKSVSYLEDNKRVRLTLNIAKGQPRSILEITDTIEKICGLPLKLCFSEESLNDVKKTHACTQKAKKILGFIAHVDIFEGLKKTINYFHNNPEFSREN